jgi:hypothetical protein
VKRIYEQLGTGFEVAVFDLLTTAGLKAELLDERKTPGCADILVHTPTGNIQLECKTRARGLVTNSEAFEVLGKTIIGPEPIAYVTVGKPGFVDVAIKNSYTSHVALVNHKILCEIVISVLEQKRTVADILRFLQLRHHIDKRDLR